MNLVNPFESVSKAQSFEPQSSTTLRALVRTGGHLGHGQDLKVVRRSGGGGRKAGLEHYGRKGVSKGSVRRGLELAGTYAPSAVPKAAKQSGRVKSGTLAGRQDVNRRQLSMEKLRGSLSFGDAGSRGARIR